MFPPIDLKRLHAPTTISRPRTPASLHASSLIESPEKQETKGALAAVCTPTLKSNSSAMKHQKLLTLRALCVYSLCVLLRVRIVYLVMLVVALYIP